jgi:hypothetical protein
MDGASGGHQSAVFTVVSSVGCTTNACCFLLPYREKGVGCTGSGVGVVLSFLYRRCPHHSPGCCHIVPLLIRTRRVFQGVGDLPLPLPTLRPQVCGGELVRVPGPEGESLLATLRVPLVVTPPGCVHHTGTARV